MNLNSVSIIDSHCHLDFECFDLVRSDLINDCVSLGIKQFIVPAVQSSTWPKTIELAQQYPQIYFTLGLHPYFIQHHAFEDLASLVETIEHVLSNDLLQKKLVGVGEIGLDFSLPQDTHSLQCDIFEQQLDIAKRYHFPIIIHHRQSIDKLTAIIKNQHFSAGGVFHAFSGSYQQAKKILDLGFKLGVGGTITYPRAIKTRTVISKVPLSSLLLETDSPDMPIMGYQGQVNTPKNLQHIINSLLELRSESKEQILEAIRINTHAVFPALINTQDS